MTSRSVIFAQRSESFFSGNISCFLKISMDDKEYYSLMNRSSSWALQQALKKKNSTKKALSQAQKTELPDNAQTFTSLELRQGRADAEMLLEKKSN